MGIETRSQHQCFGGKMGFYSHASSSTRTVRVERSASTRV